MAVNLSELGNLFARRDLKFWVRAGMGALLALNLIALYFVMYPPGGSADDLDRQMTGLRTQVQQRKVALERARRIGTKVDKGRSEGDQFLEKYFLSRRTAYSSIVSELFEAAKRAQIRPREHAYTTEPIEGSETLSMMTITANYEGSYADLLHYIQELDRMPRLLIIETLNAAPVQGGGGVLNVTMKLDTFVREDGGALPAIPGSPEAAQPGAEPSRKAAGASDSALQARN